MRANNSFTNSVIYAEKVRGVERTYFVCTQCVTNMWMNHYIDHV